MLAALYFAAIENTDTTTIALAPFQGEGKAPNIEVASAAPSVAWQKGVAMDMAAALAAPSVAQRVDAAMGLWQPFQRLRLCTRKKKSRQALWLLQHTRS
jgi:hypothetical protein